MMEQTAKILFNKFLEGTCSRDEFDRLMVLLEENKHEAELRRMLEQVYREVDNSIKSTAYVGDYSADTDSLVIEKEEQQVAKPGNRGKIIRIIIAAAACTLLAFGISFFWNNGNRAKESGAILALLSDKSLGDSAAAIVGFQNKKTGRAEQKYLLLPDGTQVWLNAESSLIVPDEFDDGKRVVYLEGEAFFDVQHADKIPFIIHMPNNVTTTVLGTAFDIRAYGDKNFSVTVKRGKVRVSKDKKDLATLTVGQEIKVDYDQVKPVVKTVKEENIASWTEGKLIYDGLKLIDIIKDLERVYDEQIRLDNERLVDEVVSTSFNRGDHLDSIIKTICLLTGAKLSKVDGIY